MPLKCLFLNFCPYFVFTSCFYIPLFSNSIKSLCPGLYLIPLHILVIVWQGLSAQSKLDEYFNDESSRSNARN